MKYAGFVKRLSECTGENVGLYGGTAAVWTDFLHKTLKCEVDRTLCSDGYWSLPSETFGDNSYMLTEFKYDFNMKSKLELSKVVAQCIFYIKSIEDAGKVIPNVVLIADKNEVIVFPSVILMEFTKLKGVNWSMAASSAASDAVLMKALMDSSRIENYSFVIDVDNDFDYERMFLLLRQFSTNPETPISDVNPSNVDRVWRGFQKCVFGNSRTVGSNDQVSLFVHYITNADDFIVDASYSKISLNGKMYKVKDAKSFSKFAKCFNYVRSVKDKQRLRSTCDRFIEDNNRRMKGEFYTPTAFVDYAHDMISKEFGEDWKEKYVVWDCAWGTGNLTRDYKFKELYCSTLEQAELDIARNVNPEATKFQFDFLNDDFEKLPEGLQKAFKEGKKILFLINPPYSTANSSAGKHEGIKSRETAVGLEMKNNGLGLAQKEMYAQFLYRIAKLRDVYACDVNLALFCKPKFMTSPRFVKHRDYFLKRMRYVDGIIFNAGHFNNVSAAWGITFNLWKSGDTFDKREFLHKVVDVNNEANIIKVGKKVLYNNDGLPDCTLYWKLSVKGLKKDGEMVSLNNALGVVGVEKLTSKAIGTIFTSGTSCSQFTNFYWMLSGASNHMGNAVPVTSDNICECCNVMSVAKLATCDWLTDKDEMRYPNTEHSLYKQFSNDAVVFSTFNGLASSLRKVEQGGKLWDIKNEFFWMSRLELMELADEHDFEELYDDAYKSDERFVYKKLCELDLSPEAQAVCAKACEIVRKSFPFRKDVHESHPEYHLNAWDAGWYQIKKLVNELPHLKRDMDEFKELFKKLSDKMRPMVYELGFLKK